MILQKWDKLPETMKNNDVKYYYDILAKRKVGLVLKRLFDFFLSLVILIILFPFILIIAVVIKIDSPGPVLFRQTRVTQYGKHFRIFKFRTMMVDAEKAGGQLSTSNDPRITKAGAFLRKYRLDEIPQAIDVLRGTMTFVGTRPEVPKYVDHYTNEMMATLLLPAGITSTASIEYKDEHLLLSNTIDPSTVYVNEVLPEKMKYNLISLSNWKLLNDVKTLINTGIRIFR